ncbi:Hypothetical protein PHPALM_13039 [Phytophthora palmivora]|uniref:PiggyBac transposable element-derived protein domain-containing protein n=1 Tax=Phytophthora palmivora TaxID=4796 RepID=A0A2P4XY71_9STRA|nr:Hypothetical protein PHPALM_13039 [Phytophthora palmivora]
MIPSRSRHNATRQFMKDKPHKRGTKLFMTCCADTAYCLRLEVFCGTEQHSDELGGESPTLFDPNSGPTAVIRILQHVLPPPREGVYHAVVTDRFYTSVQLAMQLLARNVYSAGTIQTNKKGFPPTLIYLEGQPQLQSQMLSKNASNVVVGQATCISAFDW